MVDQRHTTRTPAAHKRKARYGFFWVTLGLFLFSLVAHWVFGWYAFVNEAHAHAQAASTGDYLIEMMRDTMENWQSEFLQLMWQVAGLAFLWFLGSPQSKEAEDRLEAKLDYLLAHTPGGDAKRVELDELYPRK